MSKLVAVLMLGGIFVLPLASPAYGGSAQDHLPKNNYKVFTPEEQARNRVRQVSFDARMETMRVLIKRAQDAKAIDSHDRILWQHWQEMEHGLSKIRSMKYARKSSDVERRIEMVEALAEQLILHEAEQGRLSNEAMRKTVTDMGKKLEAVADVKYMRSNADVKRKLDTMEKLMSSMTVRYHAQARELDRHTNTSNSNSVRYPK